MVAFFTWVVMLLVDNKVRSRDLNCSKDFAAYIAKELVPFVRSEQHTSTQSKQTTVGGLSLGGVMAAYCALNHPDVFGNVISQSGAFWVFPGCFDTPPVLDDRGGRLIDAFVKDPDGNQIELVMTQK